LRESEFETHWRVDDPKQAAAGVAAHRAQGPRSAGGLLADPIPAAHEKDRELHDRPLAEGMDLLVIRKVPGKDLTPVLLEHFHTASGGASLDANEELVASNVALAAAVAVELAQWERAQRESAQ